MTRAERAYRVLLRLALPATARPEDREEMVQVFLAMRSAVRRRGGLAWVGLVVRVGVDLTWTALTERLAREPSGPSGKVAMGTWGGSGAVGQALRSVRRRPVRTVAVAGTIAMAVGAGTLVTVLVRDVLLASLPYDRQAELLRLREQDDEGRTFWASRLNFEDWRDAGAPSVSGIEAATIPVALPVLVAGRAVRADVAEASSGLFGLLGARFSMGRAPAPDEAGPGAVPVAVVSHGFWTRELAGATYDVTGGVAIVVGRETFPVVGVLEPDFGFMADGGAWGRPDVWLPMERTQDRGGRRSHGIHVVARATPGATLQRVDADLDRMAARVAEAHGEATDAVSVLTTSLEADLVGGARRPLGFLIATAAGVLLVAVLNLAGTLLVDGLGRQRELAVRQALGAGRGHLFGQLVAEAVVAAAPGAALGLATASGGLAVVRRLDPGALPRLETAGIDAGTFLVAAVIAVGVSVVACAIPGFLFSRGGGARAGSAARAGTSPILRRVWSGTIVLQVALTFALLVGTGGLFLGLLGVLRTELGYEPDGVLAVQVTLPESRYPPGSARTGYFESALARLRALPEVEAASLTTVLPHVTQAMISGTVNPDREGEDFVWAGFRPVDPEYFDVLGIPMLRGAFPPPGADAAVVDATLAGRLLDGDALGGRVRSGMTGVPVTVRAVVGAVREWGLEMGLIGTIYVDFRALPDGVAQGWMLARGRDGRLPPADVVRRALGSVDPQVPLVIEPLEAVMGRTLGSSRLVLATTAAFGLLGLIFAAIGIWVVVAFVARRSARESGIRLVLGARPGVVRGRAVARGLVPALLGVAGGCVLALVAARAVASRAPDAASAGPAVYAAAAALLLLVAAGAGYPPARRTTRIDLTSVLREE